MSDQLELNLDSKQWDLIPVSREEFNRRVDEAGGLHGGVEAQLDAQWDNEEEVVSHYTNSLGQYIGTIKASDDGVEYLVTEMVDA